MRTYIFVIISIRFKYGKLKIYLLELFIASLNEINNIALFVVACFEYDRVCRADIA